MSDDERRQRSISRSLTNAKEVRATLSNYNKECLPAINSVIDSLEAEMSRRALAKLESFKTQPELSL